MTNGARFSVSDSQNDRRANGVGENWLNTLDPGQRLLCFASLVRVFTLGQAARYAWGSDARAARKVLESFVWQRRWLRVMKNSPLPKDCGGGTTDVYYLTLAGISHLKKIAPTLARYARRQPPRGVLRQRIPHDLLIAEAYLYIHERCLILEFIPEETLKSRLRKNGGRRTENGDSGSNREATGDFKVRVVKRGQEGAPCWVECEVSLHLDADQIAAKPAAMVWFTASRQQSDIIETVHGLKAILLADVVRPCRPKGGEQTVAEVAAERAGDDGTAPPVQRREHRGGFNEAHQRVLEALKLLGGCATAEAIAGVLRGERSGVSRTLKELETTGKLRREDIHFHPGRDRGRPRGLYLDAHSEPQSLGSRWHRLMLSQVVVVSTSSGYRVHAYDGMMGVVELRYETYLTEPPLIFLIDDPQVAVSEISKRLALTRSRYINARATVVVAMIAEERMSELYRLVPQVEIYDVSQRLVGE
ncbi:MAG TPA: hypothetical protein VJ464_25820 [Blastocatellia bacterium]|nr:hypothetical protein [Blastocatellia bacterium]